MSTLYLIIEFIILALVLGIIVWFLSEIISWLHTYFFTKAPYIPNKKKYVRQALELADAGEKDILFDLGSGDGRVLAIALREFKANKAVGYEADFLQTLKTRLRLSMRRSSRNKWKVYTGDLFKADLSDCSVIYLYLYPQLLVRVVEEILPRLNKGTRVVVCRYPFEKIAPAKSLKSDEYEIFLYVI